MLATLLCESAEPVFKMNSLILVLFLGATVALAEIHVGNDPHHGHHHGEHKPSKQPPPTTEPDKVADEESDSRRPHPSFGPVMVSRVCFITT